ncbi:hypothetical protein BDQ17DRAFT_1364592 [Cyathus striatus]|nr:hypothetical protein BDQ17DRAFT_1364592 [Cyathus striatus]
MQILLALRHCHHLGYGRAASGGGGGYGGLETYGGYGSTYRGYGEVGSYGGMGSFDGLGSYVEMRMGMTPSMPLDANGQPISTLTQTLESTTHHTFAPLHSVVRSADLLRPRT